jgi:hypothetical protein
MKRNKKAVLLFVCVAVGLLASCSNSPDRKDGVNGTYFMDAIPDEAGLRGNTFVDNSAVGAAIKIWVFRGDGKTFTTQTANTFFKYTCYVISCIKAPAGYVYPDGGRTTWVIKYLYNQTDGGNSAGSGEYVLHVGTSDLIYNTNIASTFTKL